jgi:uncharacterized protein (DUF1810 family)
MAAPYFATSAGSAPRNAAPCLLRRDRLAIRYRDIGSAHNLLAAMSRISQACDLKFRSFMTLFARVTSNNNVFIRALRNISAADSIRQL